MKHLSVLIKPASSLCNLKCKYCFYANISSLREVRSYGIMKVEVMERLIDNIYKDLDDGDQMTFSFQGGEPTLATLSYFERFTEYVKKQTKKVQVHYAIQTNGTLLNKYWAFFLKENNFLVGLSIDGTPYYHNLNRVNTRNKGTFDVVLEAKKLLDEYQVEYNILCVLTNDLAIEPDTVFDFIKENEINYIQFIPCMDDLDAEKSSGFALTPERFASFYKRIYDLWEKEFIDNRYYSINLIDAIIHLVSGHGAINCGMLGNCKVQYVVEADGSVYPCDFYVLDENRLGYLTENTLFELLESSNLNIFLCEKSKPYEYCDACPFVRMCQGGCKRMKYAMYLNAGETYCGYQDFLVHKMGRMQRVSQILYQTNI